MPTLYKVSPPMSEIKIIKEEPSWEKIVIAADRYNKELVRGLNWHNYVATIKDYRKYVEEYIKENRDNAKTELKKLKEVPDNMINSTLATLMRMEMKGFALSEHHATAVFRFCESLLSYVKPVPKKHSPLDSNEEHPAPRRKTVQENIASQVDSLNGDFLDMLSTMLNTEELPTLDFLAKIHNSPLKSVHFQMIRKLVDRYVGEIEMAYNKTDEQLAEGYAYVPKRRLKKVLDALTTIQKDVATREQATRVQRVTKKKPTDKKKMAAKLRFSMEALPVEEKSTLSGLPSVQVIGATTAWVYDTKTRKLAYFESEVNNGLFAQGPMLRGFTKSGQKTLRKPNDMLDDFMKLRKHNKRKEWFDALTTKEASDITGRTLDTMLLLKVE